MRTMRFFDERLLPEVLALEYACFPKEWHYPDAERYYRAMLSDYRNINLLLMENDSILGFLLAIRYQTIREELIPYDPDLGEHSRCYYVETIQVRAENRGWGGAKQLLSHLCREGVKEGVCRFAIHARTTNGFNKSLKKHFRGMIAECRKIDRWHYGGNEPYEYIEWLWHDQDNRKGLL